jgi:carbon-monoxide dehydrogenase large subunit
MEAARDDIVFEGGKFVIAGTDRAVDLSAVAKHSFHAAQLPNEIETGFTERANFGPNGSATFPSGAHLAEVEIDAETGEVKLTRYALTAFQAAVNLPFAQHRVEHGANIVDRDIKSASMPSFSDSTCLNVVPWPWP